MPEPEPELELAPTPGGMGLERDGRDIFAGIDIRVPLSFDVEGGGPKLCYCWMVNSGIQGGRSLIGGCQDRDARTLWNGL